MMYYLAYVLCAALIGIGTTSLAQAAPFLYLADDLSPGHVSVVDIHSDQVVRTIVVGGGPSIIGLNADETQLYVHTNLDNMLVQIDTRTNTIVRRIADPGASEITSSLADPSRAYFTRGAISVLDTSTGAILHTFTVPAPYLGYFVDAQVSPDGNRIYASDYFDGLVFVLDTHSYELITAIPGIFDPTSLSLSPDGAQLYVVGSAESVFVVNTTTFNIDGSVAFYSGGGLDTDQVVASPDGDFVYVTNVNTERVAKIDLRNFSVTNIPVSGVPVGIAVSADGRRIYARMYSGEVQVLSRDASAVVDTLEPKGNRWYGRNFVGEPAPLAFVGNGATNHVSVIRTNSNDVFAGPELGAPSKGVAISPDGLTGYFSDGGNTVAFADLLGSVKFDSVDAGQSPVALAVSPDGQRLYVADQADRSISVVDVGMRSVVANIPLAPSAGTPTALVLSPDGKHVYVAAGREVAVIDTAGQVETSPLDQFGSVCGVAISSDGSVLTVTLDEDDLVRQLALPTNTIIEEVYVGPSGPVPTHYGPCAVALSPDGERSYVANTTAGSLSVVDNVSHDLVGLVSVGADPSAISVTPDDRHVYVANMDSDSVSVISGATLTVEKTLFGFSKPDAIGRIVEARDNVFRCGFE